MSWGTRIIIAYILGVIFILYFVIRSMMLNTELVEENYYDKELSFNTHIEGVNNANKMMNPIKVIANSAIIGIIIDSSVSSSIVKGAIRFYNPASQKSDKNYQLTSSVSGNYFFDKSKFDRGKYIVQVSFEFKQKPYYTEQSIFIK